MKGRIVPIAACISDLAFGYCSGLISVTIGSGMTSIGKWAFRDCSSLTSVTFASIHGWWYASSRSATSGTYISYVNIRNASVAATLLAKNYCDYYWGRTV